MKLFLQEFQELSLAELLMVNGGYGSSSYSSNNASGSSGGYNTPTNKTNGINPDDPTLQANLLGEGFTRLTTSQQDYVNWCIRHGVETGSTVVSVEGRGYGSSTSGDITVAVEKNNAGAITSICYDTNNDGVWDYEYK